MLSFDPSVGLIVPGGPQSFRPQNFSAPNGLKAYFGLSIDCLDFNANLARNLNIPVSNIQYTYFGLSGTASYASGYTVISRNSAFANNDVINNVQIYSLTAFSGKLKIMLRNGANDYTLIQEQAWSHGGTGWEDTVLSPSYTVPATGSYYVGIYSATNPTNSCGSQARSYHLGDTGTSNTGWTEDVQFSFGCRGNPVEVLNSGDATLNNLTASNIVNGTIEQGLKFNGSSSYVNFSTAGATAGIWNSDSQSLSFWLLDKGTLPGGADAKYILSRGPNGTAPDHGIYYYTGNLGMSIQNNLTTFCAFTDLQIGDHLCFTFNFPSWTFYKNAIVTNAGTSAQHFNLITGGTAWSIGRQGAYNGYYWDGAMNELRFYDRTLYQGEVNEIYKAGLIGRRNSIENYALFMQPISAVGPNFIPAWAAQSNIPVIGAGTY